AIFVAVGHTHGAGHKAEDRTLETENSVQVATAFPSGRERPKHIQLARLLLFLNRSVVLAAATGISARVCECPIWFPFDVVVCQAVITSAGFLKAGFLHTEC